MKKLIELIIAQSQYSQTTYIEYLDFYGVKFRYEGVPYKVYSEEEAERVYNEVI